MHSKKQPRIHVYPADGSSDRFIASFSSEVLDATFSVIFNETITGAVALHTFAEMIRKQYNQAVDIVVKDAFSLSTNSPVQDILKSLENPFFVRMGS